VLIEARLRHDRGWSDARILDISRRGLMVRAGKAPANGTYVEICRGTHRIVARVVWVSQDRFGARAQDAIAVDAVVTGDDAPLPVPANDRRRLPRRPSTKEREDRSRNRSRRIEFGAIVVLACAAAFLGFDAVRSALSKPLSMVAAAL
jgi:hypothetical protein